MFNEAFQRPFSLSAEVSCRSYSMPLERVLTDFGADESFGNAVKKVEAHYGVTVPRESARKITEKHALIINKQKKNLQKFYKKQPASEHIITEIDGAMIPTVQTNKELGDRRKGKKLSWMEARLALAYAQGSIDPFYAATLGSVDDAGDQLYNCVKAVGNPNKSRLHCVSDGAVWIAEQVERLYGGSATHLIDFYHLSEYLSKAAHCVATADQVSWVHAMQKALKENKINEVIKALTNHMNDTAQNEHECGAAKCYQYISNRLHKFDYQGALALGLPIGSGRIESGNRSITQKRLKIPGAWWQKDNGEAMLALRTTRANGLWQHYWAQYQAHESSLPVN